MQKLDLELPEFGVKIGGRTINSLRHADDIKLLAENKTWKNCSGKSKVKVKKKG